MNMTKLKYVGDKQYLMMIPKRDIDDDDIRMLIASYEHAVAHLTTEKEVIDYLVSTGLYKATNDLICAECGKPFKTRKALDKHENEHIIELAEQESDDGNSINRI